MEWYYPSLLCLYSLLNEGQSHQGAGVRLYIVPRNIREQNLKPQLKDEGDKNESAYSKKEN